MKGTLFSADFIEDSSGELRLLEINTDTQAMNLQFFDYTDFISVLQQNNISKVTVVHKPHIHQEMVNHISSSLNTNAPFITSFTEVKEGPNVIYPTSVTDESDLFVLRLAYDESSIFDSEYAKGTLNLLKLFSDYNESGMVPEYYHSSSLAGVTNTINPDFNPNNLPDCVVKNIAENQSFAGFYKIGSESESDTNESRWNSFISNKGGENVVIEKYHLNSNTLTDNKVSSIRSYSIIYGSDLSLIHLAQYKPFSAFELPTVSLYDPQTYVNKIDTKHYYEFATNIVKYEGVFDGILNTHLIIKSDESEIEAGNIVVGDELKSFYIGGTDQNENNIFLGDWQHSGSTLPTGSYMTSSVVIYKATKQLENNTLSNITVNNNEDSMFVATVKSFLVYDSVEDKIRWKNASSINENTDYLIDYDGSTAQVTSNEVFITNENTFSLVELDVEDTDTYIIAGTTPINSFVTHNSPCFVGDTKISLSNGEIKNIEDVVSGDEVCTFDLEKGEIVHCKVLNVYSKVVDKIVSIELENGETVKCTLDHPLYINGKGWSSFDNEESNSKYSLEKAVEKIEVGDLVKLQNGETKILKMEVIEGEVKVYNLVDIEKNHNFFANNILVHNRFCFVAGTEVEMENNGVKKIEEIEVGDVVLTFNEETKEQEHNKVTNVYSPNHSDLVKYEFTNGTVLTCTFDHPFYVNGLGLASYKPEETNEKYKLEKEVVQIKVGDIVNLSNLENTEIKDIVVLSENESTKTYIITVENNHNFYANKVLVHNKCFVAGTIITLANGSSKVIEEVVIGEEVLTFNEESKENELGVVGDLKKHEVDSVIKLSFEDGNVITTTEEHPFFVIGKGWVVAKELSNVDNCMKSDSTNSLITNVEVLNETHVVYNLLSVSSNHNFYANGILVHNKL
jgi:intein/homing endonuclease